MKAQFYKSQNFKVTHRKYLTKTAPRYIITEFLKTTEKEKILKTPREKCFLKYRRIKIKNDRSLLVDNNEHQKIVEQLIKVQKKKSTVLNSEKISFENKSEMKTFKDMQKCLFLRIHHYGSALNDIKFSISSFSLLGHRNAIDFCILMQYPATNLNSLITYGSILVNSLPFKRQ